MSFYKLSDGSAATATTSFEVEGGSNYVFADGATLLTMIDEAKWTSFNDGEKFINLRFSVVAPHTDVNGVKISSRKLFAKLYPVDGNRERQGDKADKKRDRDIRMLLAIDANVYGKLAGLNSEPTDADLQQALCGKPMVTRWGQWNMDGKKGNWLQAVMPSDKPTDAGAGSSEPQQQQAQQQQQQTYSSNDSLDEIPF